MANREQHGDREKKKPKKEKLKTASVEPSFFSSAEAKQKATPHHGKK